jgi:hypothetical protein
VEKNTNEDCERRVKFEQRNLMAEPRERQAHDNEIPTKNSDMSLKYSEKLFADWMVVQGSLSALFLRARNVDGNNSRAIRFGKRKKTSDGRRKSASTLCIVLIEYFSCRADEPLCHFSHKEASPSRMEFR